MSSNIRCSIFAMLLLACVPGQSQELTARESRSLDGQVQEIKSDVLDIAAELDNLEERLLYPSNTQLAVFVQLAEGEDFRLDGIRLTINGELATHHIYSFEEVDALKKGGVQRLYTGNVATGQHEVGVEIIGKLRSGKDFTATETVAVSKDVAPRSIGVILASPGVGNTPVSFGDW